jgi:hypothetical protein
MRGGYVGLMNCVFAAQKAVRLFHLSCDCHYTFPEITRSFAVGYYHGPSPKSLDSPTLLDLDSHYSARHMPTREC